MKEKTLIGIDYGLHFVGFAVKAAGTTTALPLHTFECASDDREKLIEYIQKVCEDQQCDGIVIGMPLSMDGSQNAMTVKTAHIAHEIKKISKVPVYYEDERLTTKAAGDHDKAAALILQSFIDRHDA